MTEQTTSIESAAPPEVQARAIAVGWQGPDKFRGDPSKFIDAQEYLDHAEQVMPILRKNNQELFGQLGKVQQDNESLKASLKEAQESIEALKQFSTQASREAAERARENLLAELKAAKREGDTDREVDLTAALTKMDGELRAAEKTAAAKPTEPSASPSNVPPVHPDFVAWLQSGNDWYGKNARKTALMNAVAQELRQDPMYAGVVGRQFLDLCAQEVAKTLGETGGSGVSKTEAGRPSGGTGGGGGASRGGKSYRDLPADAKAVCDADIKRFVGKGKAFETAEAWQSHYASVYFAGE